jgi:hypothetical protein
VSACPLCMGAHAAAAAAAAPADAAAGRAHGRVLWQAVTAHAAGHTGCAHRVPLPLLSPPPPAPPAPRSTNKLMKRLEQLKQEKQALATEVRHAGGARCDRHERAVRPRPMMSPPDIAPPQRPHPRPRACPLHYPQVEQEEEMITNTLQKKLEKVRAGGRARAPRPAPPCPRLAQQPAARAFPPSHACMLVWPLSTHTTHTPNAHPHPLTLAQPR